MLFAKNAWQFLFIFPLNNLLSMVKMSSMTIDGGHFGFYGNFHEYKQRILAIPSIRSLTVRNADVCIIECMSTPKCLSVNVFPENSQLTCEFLNETWYENNCKFKWSQYGSHHTVYVSYI